LVFGYTPNYLRVACKIPDTESIENKIITSKMIVIEDNYISSTLSQ